ncbi:MAG: hypothetical protein JWP91_1065 [Fibrobacteres bacterium]|nr:hypothetical protein [Fibrobacterota bacterium]
MENILTRWLHRHKEAHHEVTLEDVTPLHPEEYPARHLKEKLDARREDLRDIEDRSHPTGMPEGPGGY